MATNVKTADLTGTEPVSKYIYLASITSYFTFYLIHCFGLAVESAQLHLFVFLWAVAMDTILGGPRGDRFRRKNAG